jgi:regulator of replication initiation timing
MSWRNKQQHQ